MTECFLCQKPENGRKHDMHHEQYEPEIVVPLCHVCHMGRHKYLRSKNINPEDNRLNKKRTITALIHPDLLGEIDKIKDPNIRKR